MWRLDGGGWWWFKLIVYCLVELGWSLPYKLVFLFNLRKIFLRKLRRCMIAMLWLVFIIFKLLLDLFDRCVKITQRLHRCTQFIIRLKLIQFLFYWKNGIEPLALIGTSWLVKGFNQWRDGSQIKFDQWQLIRRRKERKRETDTIYWPTIRMEMSASVNISSLMTIWTTSIPHDYPRVVSFTPFVISSGLFTSVSDVPLLLMLTVCFSLRNVASWNRRLVSRSWHSRRRRWRKSVTLASNEGVDREIAVEGGQFTFAVANTWANEEGLSGCCSCIGMWMIELVDGEVGLGGFSRWIEMCVPA